MKAVEYAVPLSSLATEPKKKTEAAVAFTRGNRALEV
jgi:hypothetical protein